MSRKGEGQVREARAEARPSRGFLQKRTPCLPRLRQVREAQTPLQQLLLRLWLAASGFPCL